MCTIFALVSREERCMRHQLDYTLTQMHARAHTRTQTHALAHVKYGALVLKGKKVTHV